MNRFLVDETAYRAKARQAAAEGIVMLKNDRSVLPLREGEKVSVFGRIQFDYYKSGTGSGGLVNTKYKVGILDALLANESLAVNEELLGIYRDWTAQHPFDQGRGWGQEPWSQEEMPLSDEIVQRAAAVSDAAIVIIGRTAGEDQDAGNAPGSMLLTELEEDMLSRVTAVFSRVIVLLNVGAIIDMKWVQRYDPAAVLYVWQGGQEGGNAVVDVLTGRVNPCGHLTDTIAAEITDYPSTKNFGDDNEDFYEEDIFVGYRYFETFAPEKVLYPFGFGLSYTTFSVEPVSVSYGSELITTKVRVTNEGPVHGKESVQVYLSAPQGKLGKAARILIGFAKTKVLAPHESTVVTISAPEYFAASYDETGATGCRSSYVLEEGEYCVYVGDNVRSAKLAGCFNIDGTKQVLQCQEALSPAKAFRRMHAFEDADGKVRCSGEEVPTRTYDLTERIQRENAELPSYEYTGDRGIRLGDVYDHRASLTDFIAQLSDRELRCMVRGEGMSSPKVTPGTAAAFGGVTDALQGYGIPCACCSDGPSGIRMDCGTIAFSLPNGTCLACTMDTQLNEELYEFEGQELRRNRIDTLLGPGINIHRNPQNGRNFEYFSEDPVLTGKIAAAQLKGMAKMSVTGTIKHFAGNNQEHRRRSLSSVISERALREIYLKGFEIAVREGGAYSIMTTYGALDGIWTAGNYDLCTTILRREWGYQGLVMTDWWAEINDEALAEATGRDLASMVRAQNDVYMVTADSLKNEEIDNLRTAQEEGRISRGVLARSAANILKFILRSPVMERSLGRMSEEEIEASKARSAEDAVDFDIPYYHIGVDGLDLPTDGIDTSRGRSVVYGLSADERSMYDITFDVRIDAGEVAQVPVTFTVSGVMLGTLTFNGTRGEWVHVEGRISTLVSNSSYLKLYFAQGGMQLRNLRLVYQKPFDGHF